MCELYGLNDNSSSDLRGQIVAFECVIIIQDQDIIENCLWCLH